MKNIGMKIGLGVLGVAVVGIVAVTAVSVNIQTAQSGDTTPKEFASFEDVKAAMEAKRAALEGTDVNLIGADEIVEGDLAVAKVTVVEYADYECSACAYYNDYVNAVMEKWGDEVAWVFRPYVLSYHDHGVAAASAAEAAWKQGCWKNFKNVLFGEQATWTGMTANKFVKSLDSYFDVACAEGDLAKFHEDLYDTATPEKIATTMAYGKLAGIAGTPAFYVNGVEVEAKELDEKIGELIQD